METGWAPRRLRPALDALTRRIADEPAVRAAWVTGSLARGSADDWSDIDLHLLVADGDAFSRDLAAWVEGALPVAFADAIPGLDRAYLFLTPDWVHVDVIVHDVAGYAQDDRLPARVLLDRDSHVRTAPAAPGEMRCAPTIADRDVTLFLYLMGLAVTQARRGEWVAMAANAARLRDSLLVPLMLAENGVRKSDGANRLNRYLTEEQLTCLSALPPIGIDPDQLIDAHRAIARAYLERAHRLAAATDANWPMRLEDALRVWWKHELSLDI